MKIVLSRKGFDSSIQGGGSPNWVHNEDIYPIPIPEVETGIKYRDLKFDENRSYLQIMRDLNINQYTECHFDPYISSKILADDSPLQKWEKSLGQCDIAERILDESGVGPGDLFLFFGWFNRIKEVEKEGKLKFKYTKFDGHTSEGVHMLYGYLEIKERIPISEDSNIDKWIMGHPHYLNRNLYRPPNVIYTATEKLSFDDSKPGAGLFKFEEDLILTEPNKSRTNWILPEAFHPSNGVEIKYLTGENWSDPYESKTKKKASSRGQEFVVKDDQGAIEKWVKDLIQSHEVQE